MNLLPDVTHQYGEPENRYFPRWEIDKRAQYQLQQTFAEHEARATDLSCSGTCIVSQNPLLPTQKIKLNIFLNDATMITIKGRVVWVKHFPQRNQAGICFDSIDEKTQNLILDHAFELKKEDLVNHWFKGWDASP